MSGVFVDTPYSGVNLDNLALDPHGFGAIRKEPPQRTMRLKADQQDRQEYGIDVGRTEGKGAP
jgi:hypothetical protein